MRSSHFLCGAVVLASFFLTFHVNSAFVNGQPGDSDWTIASKAAQETDDVSPAFPTLIFQADIDAGSGVYTISQEANYKLAESVEGIIYISVSDVTLDLNGYELTLDRNLNVGLSIDTDLKNIKVCNGVLRNIAVVPGSGIQLQSGCSLVCIENVQFYDWRRGIEILNGSDCSVIGCHIESTTIRGMYIVGSDRILIKDCSIVDSGRFGCYLSSCRYNIIQNCVVNGVNSNSTDVAGFASVSTGIGNLFINCTAKNIRTTDVSSAVGFLLDDYEEDSSIIDCLVNTVSSPDVAYGINVFLVTNCLIARNKLYNCDDYGLGTAFGFAGNVAIQNKAYNNSTANYTAIPNTTVYDRTSSSNPTILLHNADIS